jgi:ankyrin repeat protein
MIWIYSMIAGGVWLAALMLCQAWRLAVRRAEQALLTSTAQGDLASMQALLQRRTNVNARNAQGWTPLHIATAGGDITLVNLLLRHGADVNAESYIGATPLDHAITYGQRQDLVQLLRRHGAQGHTDWNILF